MLLQNKYLFLLLTDLKSLLVLVSIQLVLFIQPVCAEDKIVYIRSEAFSELKFYPLKKAPAKVSGLSTSTLNSEISSIVDKVHVLAGDKVKKGDVLIRLNCDDFSYQLLELSALKEETQANLSLKKYQLARSTKLYKSKNISEIELKTDQANVKVLKSKLKSIHAKTQLAKKNISRCDIKAPFSAIILQRLVNQGEMVITAQKLLEITSPEQSEVIVQLPIELLDKINISESFFVYRENKYPVTLRAKLPTIETRARHQQLHFSFTAVDKPLINAFGELHVKLADSFLPAELLVIRENQSGLFLLKENKAVFLAVPDTKPGRPFSISLPDETQIIIEGLENLLDGQLVKQLSN
jgi:RND family efflux transporter MFP subunit